MGKDDRAGHVPPRDQKDLGKALREGIQRVGDSLANAMAGVNVTNEIIHRLGAREELHGVSSLPDGTGPDTLPIDALGGFYAMSAREIGAVMNREMDQLRSNGEVTWWDILLSDIVMMAAASSDLDDDELDSALVSVGATIVAWAKDRTARRLVKASTESSRGGLGEEEQS